MPFEYERDDMHRRVVVKYSGCYSREHGLAILARHRQEDVGSYALLYDLRGLTGHPTVSDLRVFIAEDKGLPSDGRRGPVAVVTRDPLIYSRACAYAVLGRPELMVEVFRERREADSWLASQHS